MSQALLLSVAIIATCGLVYELIAGALASYLLGDSITQFSIIIGVYLFSMGIGSYVSKYVNKRLLATFIQVEFLVGLIGGVSATVLFLLFEHVSSFRILLYSFVVIIGTLVGLEIPLLMRILKDKYEFKELISKVFTIDYIGALFASILFPLVFAPYLGLMRTGFLFGIFNVSVGLWTIKIFKKDLIGSHMLKGSGIGILVLLVFGFIFSNQMMHYAETVKYQDPIIYNKKSPYQKVVITKGKDLRLFLNGNLQFSSSDEYRYHEALVHPGLAAIENPKEILVLGGGDGLAVREILKYESVEKITLVDLDPLMTKIFTTNNMLTSLNQNSLNSKKVEVINEDAFIWLRNNKKKYDFIVIDFPDPSNFSLGKLYTTTFFKLLKDNMREETLLAIQSTSPYFARKSFWCVGNTIESIGLKIFPYHTYVPSFGEWGYFIASKSEYVLPENIKPNLKYVNNLTLQRMFRFPPDMDMVKTDVNKLNNQILVRYFETEWGKVN